MPAVRKVSKEQIIDAAVEVLRDVYKRQDMSRAGRDYLQTGFYTEVFFRQHGVHFVGPSMGPKVSKGRPESPLVAPAGAKHPARAKAH